MSAIFGIYNRNGVRVADDDADRMTDALRHRGPDGSSVVRTESIAFGHLMLWTTPEALGEALPVKTADGSLTITADARIDNRSDLIAELGLVDYAIPDSQIILTAYRRWGADCPNHLLGDFAFAIWDAAQAKVFCATDHFGIKPLYYVIDEDIFAFASEIDALIALNRQNATIDEVTVARHLEIATLRRDRTFYEAVRCLLPARTLTVKPETAQISTYWVLDPTPPTPALSDEGYAARLKELFTEAVSCRMRSPYPVGSMLSGGLDSSAISCTGHKLAMASTGEDWHTFSAVFPDDDPASETEYIRAVSSRRGMRSHTIDAAAEDPMGEIDRMIARQNEPMIPGNLYVSWRLLGLAAEHGVRVVLDGFDGDNVISHGVGYLAELAYKRKWLRLAIELRGYARTMSKEPWTRAYRSWLRRYGSSLVVNAIKASDALRNSTGRRGRPTQCIRWKKAPILGRRLSSLSIASEDDDYTEPVKSEQELHYRMLTLPSAQAVVHILDRAAAAQGVECRYPFWDKRLVEFCLSLPPSQKIRNGVTRHVFRRAMEGTLPSKVQWRLGKADLSWRHRQSILTMSDERMRGLLFDTSPLYREYVDIRAITEVYDRVRQGEAIHQEYVQIWQTACLSIWLRGFDQSKVEPCTTNSKGKGVI